MKIRSTLSLLLVAGILGGCSQISQSVKSVTKLGGQGSDSYSDDQADLVVPPSLALPADVSSATTQRPAAQSRQQALSANKNYYVVVGTYPDSEQAMDTFVRLSSIGLPNATMESRTTKSGKTLHMVRLGPFKRQEQIDKVKDSLLSDGLSQFKVVES
jgi:cell division protein FtsN